jgi:hypothetical protein
MNPYLRAMSVSRTVSTRRLTPYLDRLAREVSNPHRTLVGWFIEYSPHRAINRERPKPSSGKSKRIADSELEP